MDQDMSLERTLPAPTRDFASAAQDLAVHGYCIVAEALSPDTLAALRTRVADQARGEDAAGVAEHEGPNQRIWMLANKGQAFCDLVLHPLATQAMTQLLGEHFLLSSLTANIARPGGSPMYLHADQGYVSFWTPRPVVANIAWMLDDFTEANGATRLVPGSHLVQERREYRADETVAGVGPAGSALIFDGRLIHGTGANRTRDQERRAILAYCCRPFMRQQENFALGLDPQVAEGERPELLARLGFKIWAGLGRTDAPREQGILRRLDHPTGALATDGAPALA